MSESPASQAQSSTPEINGNAETINGLLHENVTKLQEALVRTTYIINVATSIINVVVVVAGDVVWAQ